MPETEENKTKAVSQDEIDQLLNLNDNAAEAPEASGRPTEAVDAVQSPDILPQEGADKSV
ncbi:MAG: hypothetical protein JRK26_26890 [Deltaproteobacteria bacterium]|nr:hypothetical protein [Deltaproteobacteria bacterium]